MKSIDSSYLTDHLMETFSLICFWFWLNWVTIFEVFHHWMQLTEAPVGRIYVRCSSHKTSVSFLVMLQAWNLAAPILQKRLTQVFFSWIFKGTLYRTPSVAASEISIIHSKSFMPGLSTKEEHCNNTLILGYFTFHKMFKFFQTFISYRKVM